MSSEGDGSLAKATSQDHKCAIDVIRRLGDVSSLTEALILEVRACSPLITRLIVIGSCERDEARSHQSFSPLVLCAPRSLRSWHLPMRFALRMCLLYEIHVGVPTRYSRFTLHPILIAGTSANCLENTEEAEDHS